MKTKLIFLFLLLLALTTLVFSQESNEELVEFSGRLLNGENPLAYATVVIKEIGQDTLSEEDGSFIFVDVPIGTYTLLVISEASEDREFPIVVDATRKLKEFQIATGNPETVYEEDIVVTAERLKNSDGGKKTFERDDIDDLPLQGNDPISIFEQDSGVLKVQNRDGSPFGGFLAGTGQVYAASKSFSVYGGETGWNRYFYGNIQIPTNEHISNPLSAIINREAVESINVYKGVMPTGIYGPGLGGTVVLTPRKATTAANNYLKIAVSPTDPALSFNYWFTEHLSMFASARYSLANYTIVPFIRLFSENTPGVDITVKDYTYADAIFSLAYKKGNHNVSFTSLGFYDRNIATVDVNSIAGEDGKLKGSVETLPIFGAAGLSWDMLIGDSYKNKVSTYFSVYNSSAIASQDKETKLLRLKFGYSGFTRTLNYTVLDKFDWFIGDNLAWSFGMEFKYLNLVGKHEDTYRNRDTLLLIDISNSTNEYRISQEIYKLYGFTELAWNIGKFEMLSTVGVTQVFTKSNNVYSDVLFFPSARKSINYNINQKWKFSIAASISPSFLSGSVYADRLITEEFTQYDNNTRYTKPTYGVSTLPKLTWQYNDAQSLYLEPLFAYYYNFSGMHSGLIVDDNKSRRGKLFITPTQGISTGATLGWLWKQQYHSASTSYTYGYAMYDTEDYGWLPPNNDYRHQLKISYTFTKIKQFQIGVSGNLLFDVPFTPKRAIANPSGGVESQYIQENDYPFSARSYIPNYELYINIKGTIVDRKKWSLDYRVQPGNLLSMFVLSGDKILNEYQGATSKDVNNRTFTFDFIPINILQNLYATLDVRIKL